MYYVHAQLLNPINVHVAITIEIYNIIFFFLILLRKMGHQIYIIAV